MRLHADLDQPVVLQTNGLSWVPSPLPGVERRMLDRIGGEVARATSLVRYAPGASFAPHEHSAGEEFLVLEGVFADEHGAYPVGTYVRNPWGTRHAPFTEPGCTIFVKLRQMSPEDLTRVVIDTQEGVWHPGEQPGVEVMPLHEHGKERVSMARWSAGARTPSSVGSKGEELLVIEGSLCEGDDIHGPGTWMRLPPGSARRWHSPRGCLLWVKRGHLG